jgi:PKD repeat protein
MGLSITADASGSSDVNDDPLSYDYDWGDGQTTANVGATATHTYATDGTYTVTVTVTDTHGASDTASTTVAVSADPIADLTTSVSDKTVSADASGAAAVNKTTRPPDSGGSFDSNAWKGVRFEAQKDLSKIWVERSSECDASKVELIAADNGTSIAKKSFDGNGFAKFTGLSLLSGKSYFVVAADETNGSVDTYSAGSAWIQDYYPDGIDGTDIDINRGADGRTSVDADYAYNIASIYTESGDSLDYSFDWGDGASTGYQSSATAPHTYSAADAYTVTVTARDPSGETDTASNTVPIFLNNLSTKEGGTWKTPKTVWVNDGGTWKKAKQVYVNDAGTWKKAYDDPTA